MSTRQRSTADEGQADEPALDVRKAAILEAVVAEYIGSAHPVGSHHVASAPGVDVSSATVRSDMVSLEHEGYLVQPHTSAGRIPTDKGYRFFVDHLARPGVLGPAQHQQVRDFFDQMHGEMEGLLERASGLLSDLTSYAGVVVGPSHESAPVLSVQLVELASRLGLLVVVLGDGAIEKSSIELPDDLPEGALETLGSHLQRHLQGHRLAEGVTLPRLGQRSLDAAVAAAEEALVRLAGRDEADHVFVGGPSRLAGAFDAVETVRSVLSILEQQMVVVTLLRDVMDRGLSVAIGTEHGFEPLASCAVVVAPVSLDHDSGAVGLLGPTRMNYPQAMAAAHVVGERLGQTLRRASGAEASDARPDAESGRARRPPPRTPPPAGGSAARTGESPSEKPRRAKSATAEKTKRRDPIAQGPKSAMAQRGAQPVGDGRGGRHARH
jgi:heat-inducible transcriptional repressor